MIEFVTNPVVEVINDRYVVLRDDFVVKYYDYTFVVDAGFVSDFASVPNIPVLYSLLAGKAKRSAILHDWLYTTKPFSRSECDRAFLCAMESEGVDWFTRRTMYLGVRLGGSAFY